MVARVAAGAVPIIPIRIGIRIGIRMKIVQIHIQIPLATGPLPSLPRFRRRTQGMAVSPRGRGGGDGRRAAERRLRGEGQRRQRGSRSRSVSSTTVFVRSGGTRNGSGNRTSRTVTAACSTTLVSADLGDGTADTFWGRVDASSRVGGRRGSGELVGREAVIQWPR